MRVPVSWLREYVSFDMPPRELGELLSMTGTKLEAVHRIGVPAGAELFRVGRVITREQHPDADRLSLCTVDVGDGEPRQIVCGATNFDAGATVGVALPGATLPDGTVLRVAKLRGVESHGMMLSESELELSGDRDGLMLLDDGAGAWHAAVAGAADRRRGARVRDHLEPAGLPVGVRHRPRGVRLAGRRPRALAGPRAGGVR